MTLIRSTRLSAERIFLGGAESAPKPEKRPQTPRDSRQIEAEKRDFRPCFDPLFDPFFHAVKNVVFRMYRIYRSYRCINHGLYIRT